MSEMWWGREAGPSDRKKGRIVPGPGPAGVQPELLNASAEAVRAAIRDRVAAYTPDWTTLERADAGVALVRLFGTQAEPVLRRVNRLPEKALVEHLRIAEVEPLPATAAAALLEFSVAPAAGGSVLVPGGFQVGAAPATGQGDQVVFETERGLQATPATVGAVAVEVAGLATQVDLDAARRPGGAFFALGPNPKPGDALWIGLATPPGVASPFPTLSLGMIAAALGGTPPPAAGGGVAPLPIPPPPLLRWDLLDGGRMAPADLLRDETGSLLSTGVVELGMPREWRPGRPPNSAELPELLWLRATIANGAYRWPPALAAVLVNVAHASAVRSIRGEALERLPDSPDGLTRMRLSQTPVLPRSLELEVDDDPGGDVFGTGTPDAEPRSWEEVDSLGTYGPDARVFEVDYAAGLVTFGDGVHGARIPEGFRNVRASIYKAGGGAAGAVRADAVTAPITSVAFITRVTNPFPASGGVDTESDALAIRRGAAALRSGGRAVAPADYGVLARSAPGADLARAEGVSGLHPDFPGVPIPGVVGVLCVAPDRGGGPPYPTEADLRAVISYLTATAPAGVEVVAAVPRFHIVRVEAQVVLERDKDQADLVRAAAAALDTYLHPLRGGANGNGWPLGGPLRHIELVRALLAVDGVHAVPQLNVVVDGVRSRPCADQAISSHALVWPVRHELLPVEGAA